MDSYTLVLTRGTHVIAPPTADAIVRALESGCATVTVDVDILSDGFVRRGVRLATAHVVALIPNETDRNSAEAIRFASNVTAFPKPLRR